MVKWIDQINVLFYPFLQNVDKWSFDVFALNDASGDHALKFIFYELLACYDLINRFKVSNYKMGLFFHLAFSCISFLFCFVPFRVQ